MSSLRQGLRAELLARMVDLRTNAPSPRDTLARILTEDTLPAALVWIGSEEASDFRKRDESGCESFIRELSVEIQIHAKPTATAAMDQLEEMAAEVERRMVQPYAGSDFTYAGADFAENVEGAHHTVSVVLSYTITLTTAVGDPDAILS